MFGTAPKAPEETVKAYAARMHRAALEFRDRYPSREAKILVEYHREAFERAARRAAQTGTRS